MTLEKRFYSKIAPPNENGCREWTASRYSYGYGMFYVGKRPDGSKILRGAHCIAWELANQACILPGYVVRHAVCDNPPCCESSHLKLGTQKENLDDMRAKNRHPHGETHGSRTHPERMSRGKEHSARLREVLPRGDQHYSRTNPEKITRGEKKGKLNEMQVLGIMARSLQGVLQAQIAAEYKIHPKHVGRIVRGERWAHLFQEQEAK